jgi:thiamine pyrophosphokinase
MGTHVTLICRDEPVPLLEGDVIGVDAGAALALREGLNMVMAIGDFDSIDSTALKALKERVPVKTYPSDKDLPDSALAIEAALNHGYTDITIYGALGGRVDHQHANLVLCTKYPQITLKDATTTVKAYPVGTHRLIPEHVDVFSVFAFEPAELSLSGCVYPLDHYLLLPTDILGLSNRFLHDTVTLTVHAGTILVIMTQA